MIRDRRFSKNFTLYELLESQQARRFMIDEQFNPTEEVILNLEALCKNILQPIRDELKTAVSITSGYRCPRVNALIGGAARSQHLTGQAADIACFKTGNEKLFRRIASMNLPFDQMINEFNFAWVHISYDASKKRKQMLEAYKNANGETKYRNLTA